jgi:peroxiredoxin
LQQNYSKIQATGTELIAISSDNINATKQTFQNKGLKYPVLSDKDRDAISAYNVVDPNNTRIARPSTFIINKDGTVVWKSLGSTGTRIPTEKILTELGKL